MLPTSNSKIGQITAVEPRPKPKPKPRNLDDSFWKEQRENAAAILAQAPEVPPLLLLTLRQLEENPKTEVVQLGNASLYDNHLPPLIEVLHRSECGVAQLDLTFNHLSDTSVIALGNALCRKAVETNYSFCAFELTHIHLGGNDITAEAVANLKQRLTAAGRDVEVDVQPRLRDPCTLCTVGQLLHPADKSPAGVAGLRAGDEIIAFGPLRTLREPRKGFTSNAERALNAICYYLDVARSVAPLVQAHKGKSIDVVVQRASEVPTDARESGMQPQQHLPLTFVPQEWEGLGLLGCKLKPVPE
mmetsp:Transcript_49340/g.81935  ORF Transcript_49340/g.81935 Transcript_49340/m.81935 type:complete len:302 (+) Transcript_49340:77-982(+)|eukprot:CAMPEP_0119303746 /NCGR_PEP_ID=MMETSP1333-20130426/5125_1 /TAXON_ID=418940 /ORGANISM="Scyphosphaera apsteinii, Strain RCC1455" /LENGTH=301 /DNA_ID=CAMNT_0007306489 /DNA_START=97 /DNA_END=1002 /DNA_ORIENTATION=-